MNWDPIRSYLKGRGRSHAFLERLPLRARLLFFAAVLFTFGNIGFIQDMVNVQALEPWGYVAAIAAYGGLVAVAYAAAISIGGRRWLPLAIGFHLAVPAYVLPWLHRALHAAGSPAVADAAAISHRLRWDGACIIACIILGYFFFIRLIRGEGSRRFRLEAEMALAQRIHATLVPPVDRVTERFEVYGRSEPSSEVGGDLLDVVMRGDSLVACVADVSGHGVAAGTLMGMVKSAVRMKLLSTQALDAVLDDLNAVVLELQQPERFVTFAGLRFDASNTVEVALAGHLPILHVHATGGAMDWIENTHPPLGVEGQRRHATRRVAFERGDLFAVPTDGLTEVMNAAKEQLGTTAITQAIGARPSAPLAQLYATILGAVRLYGPQTDDQTLLLVRIR